MNNNIKIKESSEYIKDKTIKDIDFAVILGSGLGGLADKISNKIIIKYEDIPNFPKSTVKGHDGKLIIGNLGNKYILAMQGRFHFYEGYDIDTVIFPVKVFIEMGIKNLIVTNAAGGVDETFEAGDLMIIKDHINFTAQNPLIGLNDDNIGPRFLDMSNVYDKEYTDTLKKVSSNLNIDLKEGVYMWFTGPTYETPSEVKMARILGASAVGMSTVPEVIIARHAGMRVLGISCITNMASGILDQPLKHEEVVETSLKVKDQFENLIIEFLTTI